MKRKSKQRSKKHLNFQQLEQRQLLAADVIGQHQVNGGERAFLPTLLVNGDFETANTDDGIFVENEDVAGWTNRGGGSVEIYNYNGYDNILDLDSTGAIVDEVFQNIVTEDGTDYLLLFDYRDNPNRTGNEAANSFDFNVLVDGESAGTFTGGSIWTTGVVPISGNALNSTEIAFSEALSAGGNDGIGALLDNIRLVDVTEVDFTNGSFEEFEVSDSSFNSGLFENFQVEGFNASHDDSDDVPEQLINIETGVDVSDAAVGNSFADIDVRDNRRDSLTANVDTTEGFRYFLTFYARNDGNGGDTDELRVRWNNEWATTILPGDEWQQYSLFVTADASTTQLDFLEVGDGDGSGPQIDGIQLHVHNGAQAFELNLANEAVEQTYTPGIGAIPVGGGIDLQGEVIQSVTATLSGNVDGVQELIAFSSASVSSNASGNPSINISSFDRESGQVVLSGAATASQYNEVLNSLSYFNGADGGATVGSRQIDLIAVDASGQSQSASIELNYETDQAVIDNNILAKFIADNNLDAQEVQNGLFSVIDEPGSGLSPTFNDRVRVAYTGFFLEVNDNNEIVEGEIFDSSPDTGIEFPLTGVIQGWTLGIPEFRTGGSGRLLIPSALAYGEAGIPGVVPPNSVLVFDVNLLEII